MNNIRLITGDAAEVLKTIPAGSVQACITSPPYYQLRDYGDDKQIGLEGTPDEYVAALVGVFERLRAGVLADDGVLAVNIDDSYSGSGKGGEGKNNRCKVEHTGGFTAPAKSMEGIPERFTLAMIASGWCLRNKIIWYKPAAMPSSARDRYTHAFEPIYLFSKRERYYYDYEQLIERATYDGKENPRFRDGTRPKYTKEGIHPGSEAHIP